MENENKIKILIADDNSFIRNSTCYALKREGYIIYEAETGQAAIDQAVKHVPDIIIMDLLMPVMNGFDAIENIRQFPDLKDIPIVLITAHATKEHVLKGTKLGVVAFLVKPFNLDELIGLIQSTIKK